MKRRLRAAAAALALLTAGAVGGCGAATPTNHAHAETRTNARIHPRAHATNPTASDGASADRPPAVHVSARVRAEEASIHRRVSAALRSAHQSRGRYGEIPRSLRGHQKPPPHQVLSARPGRPAQPISGISVRMRLRGGSALALGVGPYVPVRDQGSFHNQTPATWRITFSDVHGTVPIRPSMFAITDEQGQTLELRVSVLHGGAVPATAPRGRALTIVFAARTSIGSGTLAYAPTGHAALVSWAFDAETD